MNRVPKLARGTAALAAAAVVSEVRSYRAREAQRAANAEVRVAAAREFKPATSRPARGHVAILMAAYNEAEGLASVIGSLPSLILGRAVEVIVVDDGSTDDTAKVAEAAGASVASHRRNLGQGDALRTGFAVALDAGAEIVVTMDADGQHRPDQLEDLVGPVIDGVADYVQGSRFLGDYDDAGSARGAGIRGFTFVINLVGRTSVTDCTNGFRAIRADGLRRMHLHEARFSAPEIIMEAKAGGLRMLEVPVHIRARSHGESKKPKRLGYPLGFARAIIEVRMRQLVGMGALR